MSNEQKRHEQLEAEVAALRRRIAEMDAAFNAMSEAVIVYDQSGNLAKSNPAARALVADKLAGKPRQEVAGALKGRRPDGSVLAGEDTPAARALRGEELLGEHLVVADPAGRDRHVLVSATPLWLDGRVNGAVVVIHDVTDLIELERLKDEFISVAAHELKTPVAVMKGYAQAILRRTSDLPPQRRKLLESIDIGADRIDRIVRDLLDISRLLAGRLELSMERIDLDQLVQEVVDRKALTAGPRHRLRVVRADPVAVRGDRDRLEQVVANLIDNAVRYSPMGGDVAAEVAIEDGEAVVSVRDAGVGIPEGKQAGIFQRFYRAHTGTPYDYGGMGVALYICREIVALHGGRIWFESEEGKGSTFHFSIPL